jgi:hypothetical protein
MRSRLAQDALGEIGPAAMPFSNYGVEPERIEAMREAFHRVCNVLRLDYDADDQMTEFVAEKIVSLVRAGELDPERLCIAVLGELESQPGAMDERAA